MEIRRDKRYFDETTLMELMNQIAQGLFEFYCNGIILTNLSLDFILVHGNQLKIINLEDSYFVPDPLHSIQRAEFKVKNPKDASPEYF